jgi:uncharacterized C2H2 Zn-finger protein
MPFAEQHVMGSPELTQPVPIASLLTPPPWSVFRPRSSRCRTAPRRSGARAASSRRIAASRVAARPCAGTPVAGPDCIPIEEAVEMEPGDFRCPQCEAEFATWQELDDHRRAAHRASEGDGVRCPTCGAGFGSQPALDEHVREAHEVPSPDEWDAPTTAAQSR